MREGAWLLNHDALDGSIIGMPVACDSRIAAFRREAQSPLAMSPASCDDARLMRRAEMQRDIGAVRAVRGFVIVCALAMFLGSGSRAGMSSRLLAAAQQPAETTLPDKRSPSTRTLAIGLLHGASPADLIR